MTRYERKQRPMSISAINLDDDDGIEITPREEYRRVYTVNETTSSHSHTRKTRSRWITLILVLIIVALLSIAAVIMAIYTLVISTQKSETNTIILAFANTSTTASATTTSLQCSSSPLTSYEYSTVAPSQCSNYTNNTDPTRNIGYTQSINYCDDVSPFSNTTSVWIRFLDPAGEVISNAPVSPGNCGAVATGWYAGQYPTAYFTTATSIVCFYYTTNTCVDCSLISITNCQTFYVFLLPEPPACNYRYCTL